MLHSECLMPDPEHQLNSPQMEPTADVDQIGAERIFQGDKDSLDKASHMQLQWNEAICRNMNLPEGYQKIAVLIIKWCKELDELNCAAEVDELETLFKHRFKYETCIEELSLKQKPQLQLYHAISTFSMKYNSRNNLMIVYYTGHSKFHEDRKELEFYASNEKKYREARACWNTAERSLINDVDCDVLAILDTCFASNLQKNVALPERRYELLAASHVNKPTSGPGPRSFTRALIKSLTQLLEEHKERGFTTWNLVALITSQPERQNNPPYLNDRLRCYDQRIRLAPLDTNPVKRRRRSAGTQSNCYLTLGFPLDLPDEQLSNDQIEVLTVDLPKAFKRANIALQDINWLGLRTPSPPMGLTGVVLLYSNVSNNFSKWRRKAGQVGAARSVKRRLSESTQLSPDISRKRIMSNDTQSRGQAAQPS
ncbi:hypothetical protein AOQ84DRAFT_229708 [Glonium stellatum]|uniref:Uncharacterized protein n=1 Tax=Glonium stellatum TaxID=574774 RepID=A0A8E2JVL4_9PEZI|nr:hypothetical protein AOQ84DRAFT_229708 [Glonium stellatum]